MSLRLEGKVAVITNGWQQRYRAGLRPSVSEPRGRTFSSVTNILEVPHKEMNDTMLSRGKVQSFAYIWIQSQRIKKGLTNGNKSSQ